MQYFYWLLAFFVGAGAAIQAAINSRLAAGLGDQPIIAAFISFLIGTIFLGVIMISQSNLTLAWAGLPEQPWWRWLGGLIGAAFVFSTVLLAPKIGLVNMVFLIILGQLSAGMAIDAYGLIQMPTRPLSWQKYIGILVMLLGLLIFMFGDKLSSMMK
ncbi:DMT family transporter [Moraxella canis]|uniref:DMT family transporter n=1 Tax=Moraxella canis TaxID=90239 RepID=UPI00066811DA|nr:DMT family transporter [Moraxella canis]